MATASKVGEPTLVDPTPVSASGVSRDTMRQVMGLPVGDHGLVAEVVNGGTPGRERAGSAIGCGGSGESRILLPGRPRRAPRIRTS